MLREVKKSKRLRNKHKEVYGGSSSSSVLLLNGRSMFQKPYRGLTVRKDQGSKETVALNLLPLFLAL